MKKIFALLLALALVFGAVACAASDPVEETPAVTPPEETTPVAPEGPTAEEVKGVTIPAFSMFINGVAVTQAEMAAYPMYSVQAVSINSAGTESTTTYVGFAVKDLCDAAGLKENYIWLEATADDGYAVTFTGSDVMENTTLVAVTKDGAPFSASPWFAPCTDTTTGNYLKGCVSILVNTKEEKPDIVVDPSAEGEGPSVEGLPEILDRTDKVEFGPFAFQVNGKEVNNDTLTGLSIYKITAVALNSKGEAVESGYTGYRLSDVLAACGIENPAAVKAVANDGYETELSAELIGSEYTLVAIEKDKELGEGGTIWLAPCSEKETKAYCKLVVELVAE